MTQAQQAPAPAPAPTTIATVGTPSPAVAPKGFEDVPGLLNRLQVAAVTVCLLFGVASAALQFLGWQANGNAADNTEQLVRVQEIQSSLLRADALATNAFLVGGLEPAEQRAEYDAALDDVLRGIANAAEAQPADREALAALNTEVAAYATAVAQARDNNRQGFPIGAEYVQQAADELRTGALPVVEALVAANSTRSEDEMAGQHPVWLFWIGILALIAMWWLNRQLAKRFHRRINVGLAAAAVGVAVLTLMATFLAEDQSRDNDDLLAGSYRLAVDEASARTNANDAKANESLRLIKRGSGATYEDRWIAAADDVEVNASDRTRLLWNEYADRHAEVVADDDGGLWDAAVLKATSQAHDGTTAALNAFDTASQEVVDEAATETTDALRSGRPIALVLAAATLLLGLVAAALCAWGINQRRKEYA